MTVDVSDLSDRELASVVAVCGPETVAEHTGLPVTLCRALAPALASLDDEHPRLEEYKCPACGTPRHDKTRTPHDRCVGCVLRRARSKREAAYQVLACGLRGEEAILTLARHLPTTYEYARKLLQAARREHPEVRHPEDRWAA